MNHDSHLDHNMNMPGMNGTPMDNMQGHDHHNHGAHAGHSMSGSMDDMMVSILLAPLDGPSLSELRAASPPPRAETACLVPVWT